MSADKESPVNTDDVQKSHTKDNLFKKGTSGNPNGRPKGSKNKLSEDFIAALAADFERYGLYPIARVRRADPAAYLRTIASILPREVTGNVKHNHQHQHAHESISGTVAWIEELLGTDKTSETEKPTTH